MAYRPSWWSVLKLAILCNLTNVVTATDPVNWLTVAISWAFSFLTVLIILGCYWIYRVLKKPERKPPHPTREFSVQSEGSTVTRDTGLHSIVSTSTGYSRVPSREPMINRRKSDYISKWCSGHGLSELIANNLRENGFLSREQVESLRADDVITLGLPNVAQQVQLRHVLENLENNRHQSTNNDHLLSVDTVDGKYQEKELSNTRLVPGSRNRRSTSSERSLPRSSLTDDNTSLSTPSPKQLSPSSNTSIPSTDTFHYPHKLQQVPEESCLTSGRSNIYISDLTYNRLSFNGLLSDPGLYEMAEHLGNEWRHLAAILGISKAQQEHLQSNHPNNIKEQIYEMLRLWRDKIAKGEKEQVKAQLADALQKVKRKDLSDNILREQVHGSDPNLGGSMRMNSVV